MKDTGKLSMPLLQLLLKLGPKTSMVKKGYDSAAALGEVAGEFNTMLRAYEALKELPAAAAKQVEEHTKQVDAIDRATTRKSLKVLKNVTRALATTGLWGVSGVTMHAIQGIKKCYVL